jgi:hypothetical protein
MQEGQGWFTINQLIPDTLNSKLLKFVTSRRFHFQLVNETSRKRSSNVWKKPEYNLSSGAAPCCDSNLYTES